MEWTVIGIIILVWWMCSVAAADQQAQQRQWQEDMNAYIADRLPPPSRPSDQDIERHAEAGIFYDEEAGRYRY